MARTAEQAVPHKVKLPAFGEKDVAAEAMMEDNHVPDPRVRGEVQGGAPLHLKPLAGEGQRHPKPSRHLSGPIYRVENRLVELLTPSLLNQCTSILWGAELGG